LRATGSARSAVEHNGFSQTLFAALTQNPVVPQPDDRARAQIWSADATWQRLVASANGGMGGAPSRHALDILRRFDYVVLVTNGLPFQVRPTLLLSPVKLDRLAQAYRVRK